MSLHLRVSTYTNIIIKEYVNVGRASCSHITNTDYNAFHAWDWNIQIDEKDNVYTYIRCAARRAA